MTTMKHTSNKGGQAPYYSDSDLPKTPTIKNIEEHIIALKHERKTEKKTLEKRYQRKDSSQWKSKEKWERDH